MTLEEQVIDVLKNNSRITNKSISEQLNVTEEKINKCIQNLEKNKIVLKYSAIIDESKFKKQQSKIKALIEICVRPEKNKGFFSVAKRISKYPEVKALYLISGNYDYLIVVEGYSLEEISNFVSLKLATIENVKSTATHFIMKKYKENGISYDNDEDISRPIISL